MNESNSILRYGGTIGRCVPLRAAVRRAPLPVRLLGAVGLITLGWFLIMAPLFLAR